MASDYGLNFGFRRSDESMATREGRYKTPATGNPLLLGTLVELDPAAPGFLKQSAANPAPVSGLRGLLVQEENHIPTLFSNVPARGHDTYDLGYGLLNQLSVMWAGVGTKIWLKNSPAYARGGRTRSAVQMVSPTGTPTIGDRLGWDGSKWVKSDGTTTPHLLTITAKSGSTTSDYYVEAVLGF